MNPLAKVQVIGVSEGAFQVSKFLDGESNWLKWGVTNRVQAFAAISTYWQENDFVNPWFKAWFEKRGRVYLPSVKEAGDVICGPSGGKKVAAYGCNAFALGEEYYSECMLPRGYKVVVDWLSEVAGKDLQAAKEGKGGGYVNETLEIDEESEDEDEGFAQSGDGGAVGKPAWESDDEAKGGETKRTKELGDGEGAREVEINLTKGPRGSKVEQEDDDDIDYP